MTYAQKKDRGIFAGTDDDPVFVGDYTTVGLGEDSPAGGAAATETTNPQPAVSGGGMSLTSIGVGLLALVGGVTLVKKLTKKRR